MFTCLLPICHAVSEHSKPYAALFPPQKVELCGSNSHGYIEDIIIHNHNIVTKFFEWRLKSDGCFIIGLFVSDENQQISNLHMDLSLLSASAMVTALPHDCKQFIPSLLVSDQWVPYACSYIFTVQEPGIYNISIRGEKSFFSISSLNESIYAWDHLGFVMGRLWEIRTQRQILNVTKTRYIKFYSNSNATLPLCNFEIEKQFFANHSGNPRWRSKSWLDTGEKLSLQSIWYLDSYSWGNDICRYKPYSREEILDGMDRQNISHVLFVGDSLSRFMWGDVEDIMSNCTSQWMKDNPVIITEKDRQHSKTSWDNSLSGAGGFGAYFRITSDCIHQNGIILNRPCCLTQTCTNRKAQFVINQFLPGHTNKLEPHFNLPAHVRSVDEWKVIIRHRYFDDDKFIPSVMVFNTGLWLLNAYFGANCIPQLLRIVEAFYTLCAEKGVVFVWRSTYYSHRGFNSGLLLEANNAVVKWLLKANHSLFLFSNYYMSGLRPDRTVDGIHYNYRMLRSSWHRCTKSEEYQLDSDCIRGFDWPMSVAKAGTLMLLNYLINSDLSYYRKARIV